MAKRDNHDIFMVIFFMPFLNIEIKASCADPSFIRNYLLDHAADFKGADEQTDTYFHVNEGRLKLREGTIENNLIFYKRNDQPGPKSSHFHLVKIEDAKGLKDALAKSCGLKMIVSKRREIYYIDNVKFHIDEVQGLGSFIEIEAGNMLADKTEAELSDQCNFYLKEFGVTEKDLIAESYSDMLMKVKETI
ncbi:MAG TPA: class IV adenylate cyclase [Chitinophagaceae bacterium]